MWDLVLTVLQHSRHLDAQGLAGDCVMEQATARKVTGSLQEVPGKVSHFDAPQALSGDYDEFWALAGTPHTAEREAVVEMAPDAAPQGSWVGVSREGRREALFDAIHLLHSLRDDASCINHADVSEKKASDDRCACDSPDIDRASEFAGQRGLRRIGNSFALCECVGALPQDEAGVVSQVRIIASTRATLDISVEDWQTCVLLWANPDSSDKKDSWHRALKDKKKLQALEDAVNAWKLTQADAEGEAHPDNEQEEDLSEPEMADAMASSA